MADARTAKSAAAATGATRALGFDGDGRSGKREIDLAMSARDSDNRRRADLAKIHIAKKQLQLDEEIYRDLVWRVSADFRPTDPVDSAANMTSAERKALLQELGRLGYQARPPQSEDGDWIETDILHVKKLLACAYQLIRDGAIAPPTDRTQ